MKSRSFSTFIKEIPDPWGAFLLSIPYAGYFIFLNILSCYHNGIVEKQEFILFVQGWVTVPLLTAGALWLIETIRRKFFKETPIFYSFFAAANIVFWVIAVWILRGQSSFIFDCRQIGCYINALDAQIPDWKTGEWKGTSAATASLQWVALLFVLLQGILAGILRWAKRGLKSRYTSRAFSDMIYHIAAAGLALVFINFSGFTFSRITFTVCALILALLYRWHNEMMTFQLSQKVSRPYSFLVIMFIIFCVFDPNFISDPHHQNHYLGPTADLMGGKSLLADINCQYGLLPIYFLGLAFKLFPLSYQGFAFLAGVLLMGQYILLFFVLRFILRSDMFATLLIFLIMLCNFFAPLGYAAGYPSTGPLRFGLPYLLLLISLLIKEGKEERRWIREGIVVAVASAWSFETLLYVMATFGSLVLYDVALQRQELRKKIVTIAKRLGFALFFSTFVHLILTADIFRRSGHMPHWGYYFDYLFLYSAKEFGSMLIAPWTPWLLLVLVSLTSLFLLVFTASCGEGEDWTRELRIVAGLTGLSIAQFTYFLGRSHPNNLFHIAIPAICLFAFWMAYFTKKLFKAENRYHSSFFYASYFALFLLILNGFTQMGEKLHVKFIGYNHFSENMKHLTSRTPSNIKTVEALYLVNKYAKDKKRIAIFISPDDSTETLFLSGKTNVYPYNYILQEYTLDSAKERLLGFNPPLKEGDIIFVSPEYADLQARLVGLLQRRFRFVVKEKTPHYIFAMELKAL